MSKTYWKGKHYAYFCNHECEYFPCHPTDDPNNFTVYFVTALFMYWEIIAEENLFIFQTDIRIVVIAFIRI